MKSILDAVMERRARQLLDQVSPWLPARGPILDLGSGTGHLAAQLEWELGVEVVTTDLTDIHVVGPRPVLITDGALPFADGSFSAALLLFMLHYPSNPSAVLAEADRVTRGQIIIVQSLYSGRAGYAWLRVREFVWTYVAFHLTRLLGYVPPEATFTMSARRFYTEPTLQRDVTGAGLRILTRRERPILPGRALVIATWALERDV